MKGGKQGAKPIKPGLPPGALPPAPAGLPAPNTNADLYVSPNAPPAAPDQAGVAVHLEAEFEMATQHSAAGCYDWSAKKSKAVSSHRTPKLGFRNKSE
jgi:hypothetical protein